MENFIKSEIGIILEIVCKETAKVVKKEVIRVLSKVHLKKVCIIFMLRVIINSLRKSFLGLIRRMTRSCVISRMNSCDKNFDITGKAIIFWDKKFPDKKQNAIDTDQITPASDCISYDLDNISKPWKAGAFRYLMPNFHSKVKEGGNFLVVGEKFGIGSSREMSPAAIQAVGNDYGLNMVVICGDYVGNIFLQNAINLGLIILISPDAVEDALDDDEFKYSRGSHTLINLRNRKIYRPKPFNKLQDTILKNGGLIQLGQKIVYSSNAKRFSSSSQLSYQGLTYSILAAHLLDPSEKIIPGHTIKVCPDLLPASDGTAPFGIYTFNKIKQGTGLDLRPHNCSIINDHFVYTDNQKHKLQLNISKKFAELNDIKHPYFADVGDGIFHFYLPEQGLIKPLGLYAGADSHSRTYGAYSGLGFGIGSTDLGFGWATGFIYFKVPTFHKLIITGQLAPWVTGKDIILTLIKSWKQRYHNCCIDIEDREHSLPMYYRHTIANMMAEAEVVSAVFKPDQITRQWIKNHKYFSDYDENYYDQIDMSNEYYESTETVNLNNISLQVACPYHPSNSINVYDIMKQRIKFQKAMIGSCTNGGYTDLYQAALILYLASMKGYKYISKCNLIIYPGSKTVRHKITYPDKQLGNQSILDIFCMFGAKVREPWCGPCFGQGEDALKEGEVAVTTFNRNWQNRMGRGGAGYLASPIIVAASALAGYICTPDALGLKWDEVKHMFS